MTKRTNTRRRFLTVSGSAAIAAGLGGCLDGDSGGPDAEVDGDGEDDPSNEQDDGDEQDGDHSQDDAHDHSSDHEPGEPEPELTVEMVSDDDGEHFMPHVVHVETGGTVEWVVKSGSHDTVAYHPDTHGDKQRIPDEADPWESESLSEEGDSFERTFEVEGVYDYACTPHEGTGMVGTVVVGWPDADDQPGLEPPSDDRPEAAVEQLERYNETVREVLERGEDGDNDSENGGNDSEDGDHHDDEDDHEHGDGDDDGHDH